MRMHRVYLRYCGKHHEPAQYEQKDHLAFGRTIRLSRAGGVDDQVSNPTWAWMLAETAALLLARGGDSFLPWLADRKGLYHFWNTHSRMGRVFAASDGHVKFNCNEFVKWIYFFLHPSEETLHRVIIYKNIRIDIKYL